MSRVHPDPGVNNLLAPVAQPLSTTSQQPYPPVLHFRVDDLLLPGLAISQLSVVSKTR